jgi:hypothetical protein
MMSNKPRDSVHGLLDQINSDPNYLPRLSNAQWNGPMRTMLSEYDWSRFDKQRSAQLGGEVKEAETLDSGGIGSAFSSRLKMLGIDPNPGKLKPAQLAGVVSSRAVLDQSVLAKQQQLGRRLTDVEMIKHVDEMFRTNYEMKRLFGTAAKPTMTLVYSDIPGAEVDRIEAALKKDGLPDPTKAQILTYFKQQQLGFRK